MEQAKIQHLEMIQSVINRLASSSFAYKAWMVGIVSALLALGISMQSIIIFGLSLIPLVAFWFLDSYYLHKERMYRILYEDIRTMSDANWRENAFDMDCSKVIVRSKGFLNAVFSITEIALYGSLIVVVLLLLIFVCTGLACNSAISF